MPQTLDCHRNAPITYFAAFSCCLEACSLQKGVLVISPGIYHFNSQNTLLLNDCHGLYIIAEKAEFRNVNTTVFWWINRCSSILINGLTIDWNREYSCLASTVQVKALTPNYVDFYSLDGELDINVPWATFNTLYSEKMTVGCENKTEFHLEYPNDSEYFFAKKIAEDIYRCYGDFTTLNSLLFQKDSCYLIRHHMYNGCLFSINDSCHISFEKTTVYPGSCMGFLIEGHLHHLHFDTVRVKTRKGRKISFIADIFHNVQSNSYFFI